MFILNEKQVVNVSGGDTPCSPITISVGFPPSVSVSATYQQFVDCAHYLVSGPDTSSDFVGNEPNAHDPNYVSIEERYEQQMIDSMLFSHF